LNKLEAMLYKLKQFKKLSFGISVNYFFKIGLFALLLCTSSILKSQPCTGQFLTLETQGAIDSFPINYPNCDEIVSLLELLVIPFLKV